MNASFIGELKISCKPLLLSSESDMVKLPFLWGLSPTNMQSSPLPDLPISIFGSKQDICIIPPLASRGGRAERRTRRISPGSKVKDFRLTSIKGLPLPGPLRDHVVDVKGQRQDACRSTISCHGGDLQ